MKPNAQLQADAQLQMDVGDEIKREANAAAAGIGVSAAGGVVTLTGTVATNAEKWAVVRAAQRMHGVRLIAEEITIELGEFDAETTEAAPTAVSRHV